MLVIQASGKQVQGGWGSIPAQGGKIPEPALVYTVQSVHGVHIESIRNHSGTLIPSGNNT